MRASGLAYPARCAAVGSPLSIDGCVAEGLTAELREEDCITDEEWELEDLEWDGDDALAWDDDEPEEPGESRGRWWE